MLYTLSAIGVGIISLAFVFVASAERFNRKADHAPTGDNAKTALDRIATWAIWLAGLQTAAMAAIGLMIKDRHPTDFQSTSGFFAVLFFGWSVVVCTWVLGSLPSMQLGLQADASSTNDIYHAKAFPRTSIRLWTLLGAEHTLAFLGFVSFGYFVFATFKAPPTSPNHALQRTAPRVTVAAISSSNPSRPSHLFL